MQETYAKKTINPHLFSFDNIYQVLKTKQDKMPFYNF